MIQMSASKAQSGKNWNSDIWGAVELEAGDMLYAGWPGVGAYFTDAATIKAFATSPVAMWAALQVPTNMTYGRRMQIAEFEVLYAVCVPAGHTTRNGSYGHGGGFQFMIPDHQQLLRATGRILDLHGAAFTL